MKRLLLSFSVLAFAATILVSCGSNVVCDVNEVAISEKATRDSFQIPGAKSCEVVFAPEWLQVSTNDNIVYYSASANKGDEPRESCIVLKCKGEEFVIPVVQGVKPSYLVVSKNKVEFESEGGTKRIAVLTDGGIVTIKSSIPELKVTRKGNYLTIVAEKNEGMQRVGTVKVTSGKLTKTINVTIVGKICPTCNSTGYITCRKCKGEGIIWATNEVGYYGCKACGGRGYGYRVVDEDFRRGAGRFPCPTCNSKKQ